MQTSISVDEDVLESCSSNGLQFYHSCSPYIDDSLLACHKACAASAWSNLLSVFSTANIHQSSTPGHVCPPSRSMQALGFDIDLDAGTVSIPSHKLQEMIEFAQLLLEAPAVTRQDIKKILGRISRCIMVIREGRRFIGRLLLFLQGPQLPSSTRVVLPEGAKEDLRWWVIYGPRLNTMTLITMPKLPLESVFLVDGCKLSNSSPSVGGLCYHTKEFFSMPVPSQFIDQPIHVIEAIALLAASRLWVPKLPGGHIIPIGSDNQAVVLSFQHGWAKEQSLAAMARLLWGVFATSTCTFCLRYVPSSKNSSDGVSRLNVQHSKFLLSHDWSQLFLPDSYFSLNKDDPFSYQEETPTVYKGQQPSFNSSH